MTKDQSPLPPWAIVLIIGGGFVLLVAVITVGLITGKLDYTGVSLALITLIGSTSGAVWIRRSRDE